MYCREEGSHSYNPCPQPHPVHPTKNQPLCHREGYWLTSSSSSSCPVVAPPLPAPPPRARYLVRRTKAVVMRAFRVFVEVCVLRRQPGYQPAPAPAPPSSSSTQASGNPGGASGSGGGGGDPGEVSPARTPVVVARGGVAAGGGGGAGVFGPAGAGGAVVEPDRSDFLGERLTVRVLR